MSVFTGLRGYLALLCGVLSLCLAYKQVVADEVRIVDARGLVRAVRISRGSVRVVVTLESGEKKTVAGECVATNVDGLSAEKRAPISQRSECVFLGIGGGSWQIAVPQGFSWRVQVYE
jgi:hypothetical protein